MLETMTLQDLELEKQKTLIGTQGKFRSLVGYSDVLTIKVSANAGKATVMHVPLLVAEHTLWFAVKPISDALKVSTKGWLIGAQDHKGRSLLRFKVAMTPGQAAHLCPDHNTLLFVRFIDIPLMMNHINVQHNQPVQRALSQLSNDITPTVDRLTHTGELAKTPSENPAIGSRYSYPKITSTILLTKKKMHETGERMAKAKATEKAKAVQDAKVALAAKVPLAESVVDTNVEGAVKINTKNIDEIETELLRQSDKITALTQKVAELQDRSGAAVTDPNSITITFEQLHQLITAKTV